MKIEEGVMVVKGGMGWGVVYDDGRSTSYGWIDIEEAPIHNPTYCKSVTDVTYPNSPLIPKLLEGKLVKVKRTTVVEIIDAD